MKLIINGKERIIEKSEITISDILKIKNVLMPDMVSVELNGEIINREGYSKIRLSENDRIEFLYFMGGGDLGSSQVN